MPIQNEAKGNSTKAMLLLINFCVISSLLIYIVFASTSFAAFGADEVQPNIINNYPTKGPAFIIARFLYIFLLTFSYPMVTFPSRASIFNLFDYFCPGFYARFTRTIFYGTTTAILLFTWLIASINPPLEIVLGLIGSTVAPLVSFFLPAIFWLKLDPETNRWNVLRIVCMVMIGFALLSTGLSLTALIVSIIDKSKTSVSSE